MKNGRNAALNGGRGSGQTARRISEIYEDKIADLKANFDYVLEGKDLEIKQLGERCNQLLKDKGNLTDELQELKETLAQTIENDEVAYETLKLHDQEEIGMLNSKIEELEQQIEELQEKHKQEILDLVLSNSSERAELEKENAELKDELRKLKILVSSLVYEINQIWDINEMNDDLRMCAEKIDREVQLSKMAEDNRMVISALGFAIVPPKPKLDVKEI